MKLLTKKDLAERQGRSLASINTACSRNPEAVPPFLKLGHGKNSPIRFRLADVEAWEAALINRGSEPVTAEAQIVSATVSAHKKEPWD